MTLPNGYRMESTLFEDFEIANHFGEDAIRETYDNVFRSWKENHVFMTELAIVMSNESIWWYDKDARISTVYTELYKKIDEWCMNNLKGQELLFYIQTTD